MGFWELAVLAVGLSMDAFAVSVCKGLALQRVSWKECCIAGAWFGGFQALMPLLGYLLGTQFERFVTSVDHWIAFVLLGIIGGNMIREALSKDEDQLDASLACKTMLLLAHKPIQSPAYKWCQIHNIEVQLSLSPENEQEPAWTFLRNRYILMYPA